MSFKEALQEAVGVETELKDIQEKIKKELTEKAQGIIQPLFKEFFKEYPEVYGVKWDQYTDYFNDGETCHFSIHGMGAGFSANMVLNSSDKSEAEEVFSKEDWMTESAWSLEEAMDYTYEFKNPQFKEDWKMLANVVQGLTDLLKGCFGDHVSVVITREGVDIEECVDHD